MGFLDVLLGAIVAGNLKNSRRRGFNQNLTTDEELEAQFEDGYDEDYVGDGLDGTDDYLGDGLDGDEDYYIQADLDDYYDDESE